MIWASSKPLALYSSGGIGHCWGSLTKDELLCPLIGHVRTAVPNTVSVTTKKTKKRKLTGAGYCPPRHGAHPAEQPRRSRKQKNPRRGVLHFRQRTYVGDGLASGGLVRLTSPAAWRVRRRLLCSLLSSSLNPLSTSAIEATV